MLDFDISNLRFCFGKLYDMRLYLAILVCGVILFSCSQNKADRLDGSWLLDHSGKYKSLFTPFDLYFEGDSVIMTDGNLFRHHAHYKMMNDSIELIFSNAVVKKMEFRQHSDSMICVGGLNYHRVTNLPRPGMKPYKLMDYKTNETLKADSYSFVIHLVKMKGKAKAILNDQVAELADIPDFLSTCAGNDQTVAIFLGEGIEFSDLAEAYTFIEYAGVNKAILVTGNACFDEFYAMTDSINIDNGFRAWVLQQHNMPPAQTKPLSDCPNGRQVVVVNHQTDIEKVMSINDSLQYLIMVDHQLELISYFNLLEITKGKKHILKIMGNK